MYAGAPCGESGINGYGYEFIGSAQIPDNHIVYVLSSKQHMRWLKQSDLATSNQFPFGRNAPINRILHQS